MIIYFVILSNILYLSHMYFFYSNIFDVIHSYFFSERGGNVVYAIYGTWYRIHAHKVTQPYVRLVHSSIYTIYVIYSSIQVRVNYYSRYIIRGDSHLSRRGIEY